MSDDVKRIQILVVLLFLIGITGYSLIEEIKIFKGSKLGGKTIAESEIKNKFNAIIVGIYRSSGKLIYNPLSDTRIELDDNLIVIGKREKLDKLKVKANEE